MRTRFVGCLPFIFLLGAAAIFTETGRWIAGLLLVYGAAIVGGAFFALFAFSLDTATIVEVERQDHALFDGFIIIEWTGDDDLPIRTRKQAIGTPGKLDRFDEGDTVLILVCRANPKIVSVPALSEYEMVQCLDESSEWRAQRICACV